MPSEFIKCVDCGDEFEYSERDQAFYQDRQFTPPKRCKVCRIKKKTKYDGHGEQERRYNEFGQ